MSGRQHKYIFLILALALPVLILSSCSSSKKAGSQTSVVKKRQLSDEQQLVEESTYYDATKKKIQGNYDQALSLFLQCISIDPYNAAANYEMADILEYDKQPDTALIFIKRATQIDPNNVWYQDLLAQCLQDKGKYKDVAEVYRNLQKAHPNAAEYYYKLAVSEIQAGEDAQAIQTYDQVEEKFGFNEDMSLNKIQECEKIKNYEVAEQEIQKLIKKNPAAPQYIDMLGNLYELEGKEDKAFEMYQKMEITSPHDPMVHLSLADYYRTKRNDKQSFVELKLAFAEPALDIDTKIRILYGFYSVSNGYDTLNTEALQLCDYMVKATPAEPKAHKMYGDFLLRNNELKKAQEQYEITLSEDSSKYSLWNQLLRVDEIMNDFVSMAEVSKGAMGLFPTNPRPYLDNGLANIQLKKFDEALSSLNKGLNYVIDDSAISDGFYSLIGDASNAIKHYASSDSAYEEALKMNPNDNGVLNNYSYYLSLRDTNLSRAAEMSKKSNQLAPNNSNYEDTYSWIFYKMGKYQDAKDWEEKAMQNGGRSHSDMLDHYGDILYKLGDKEQAVEYWQKAKDAGLQSDLLDRKIRDKQLYEK